MFDYLQLQICSFIKYNKKNTYQDLPFSMNSNFFKILIVLIGYLPMFKMEILGLLVNAQCLFCHYFLF